MAAPVASTSAATHQDSATADIMPAFNAWRQMLSSFTGLALTEEQKTAQAQNKATLKTDAQNQKECKRCENWRDEVIRDSPIVRFMLGHVDTMPAPEYIPYADEEKTSTANSPVPIYCAPCGADRGGGFQPHVGVILCQDKIFSKKHVEDTLAHELIHEWDDRRFKVDWMNLRHVACSEIRAASLSGDCRWGRELQRRNFSFTKQHQACTKRRAILSVLQHPSLAANANMTDDAKKTEASRIVNEVWQSCWNDTRPFDEIF